MLRFFTVARAGQGTQTGGVASIGSVMRLSGLVLALFLPLSAQAGPLVIVPVKLLDTSHEAQDQSGAHARRLDLLAEVLAGDMQGEVLGRDEVAAACPRETADCLIGLLRRKGAERGLFVVVQKSSTLILQIFASLVDLRDESLIRHRELNFRGDNDEAWRRAGHFLAGQLRDGG